MKVCWLTRLIVGFALLLAGACGDGRGGGSADRGDMRIVVISHGQSSDPFWSVVANGITDAAGDLGLRVEYQAPVTFDMVRMSQMIEAAVASRPDGLLVSVPDGDALAGSLRHARSVGIPVVSINSGAEVWESLGLLAHIGQSEFESAHAGGQRLAAAGARRVLCVNHEIGNLSLDERCHGLREAIEHAGGFVNVLAVNLADPTDAQQRVASALRSDPRIDGALALGPGSAVPVLAALRSTGKLGDVAFGTFDLESEVLAAIRDGEILFAIDQQPYLQGYLGVVVMVKFLETGSLPGGGQIIRTGPGFITQQDAADVIRYTHQGVR
jgi:simple sugar transport system substrate-binding protein